MCNLYNEGKLKKKCKTGNLLYSAFSICVRRGVYNFHKRQTEGQTAFNTLRTGILFGSIRTGKGLIGLKVPWEEIKLYIYIYFFHRGIRINVGKSKKVSGVANLNIF